MLIRNIIPVLLACFSLNCFAVGDGGTQVEFSGTVVTPPDCSFNNGQMIEVPFGYVGIGKADGRQLEKTVAHHLVCRGKDASKTLKMQISGTQGMNPQTLATSIDGLGIRFYQNGNVVSLEQWFALPAPVSQLLLTAAPLLTPGATPQTGNFQATATLMVTFQ